MPIKIPRAESIKNCVSDHTETNITIRTLHLATPESLI